MQNIISKNSKINLINNKQKIKTLKENHFSKFINSLKSNPDYYFISNNNIKNKNQLYGTNSKIILKNKETNKENTYQNSFQKRKNTKSPKLINYHLHFKAPQFKNLKLDKETNSFNFELDLKQNNSTKVIKNKKIPNINKADYEPIKISNNQLNFDINNEISKTSQKIEEIRGKLNINDYKEKNKKLKINYKYNIKEREGYYGRKENLGIPYLFDTFSIFCNNYSNKSEKNRHEIILNDLLKLKGFLKGNPNNTISIFKDFLKKYNINNLEKFSDKKILTICNIICKNDNDILIQFLKPYLNVKEMILDLIDHLSTTEKDENKQNINMKMRPINYNFSKQKEKLYLKQNNSSVLFKDDLLFKTKVNLENENNKENQNEENDRADITHKKTNKDFYYKTENSFYNKYHLVFYQSPFFIPFKSHYILSPKIKINKKGTELNDTNSLLKNLNYQTKALGPRKEYSSNNDLLIDDMRKEIKELEKKYYKVLNSNDTKNRTHFQFSFSKNKVLSHSPTSNNYINKDFKLNNKEDIFSKTTIHFFRKNKMEQNKKKLYLQIISLKKDKIDKLKKLISKTEPSFKRKINKKAKSLNEINIRMYYKPIKYKFGYKQIKDQNRITEMAALNFGLKKKFDPMGLICHF